MAWNHRVFRCIDADGSPYYEIRETHYDDSGPLGAPGKVNGWSESASAPIGDTFRELIKDLSRFLAALAKPILDDRDGSECEPAQMCADDLQKWMDARADTEGEA